MATVSAMAPRPTTLRMARVLPPSFSASVATRDISRGVSAIFRLVERGLRAGLGLHAADVAHQMHEAAGALDLDRLARGADRQRRFRNRGADDRLLQPAPVDDAPQHAADRKAAISAPSWPVLRAAFATDSPTRAGAAAPSVA